MGSWSSAPAASSPLLGRWTPTADGIVPERQPPPGMFAETRNDVQVIDLEPGDRLFVVSHVWAADPVGRGHYGDQAMGRALRATRLPHPPESVGTVMRELRAWHDGADLRDAVVVCLDWRGRDNRNWDEGRRRDDGPGQRDYRRRQRVERSADLAAAIDGAAEALIGVLDSAVSRPQLAVSPTQLRVLSLLSVRPDTNVNGLAELLDVVPSSASRLCDRLEATGLLRRVGDPRDRREVRLVPTPAAESLLREVRERRHRAVQAVLDRMSGRAQQELLHALLAFSQAAKADGPPPLRTPRPA